MIKYLKFKIYAALIAINILAAIGFYEFIKNGSTILLVISSASLIFHFLLYYFFVKKKEV
ncbi:hypothetical protein [Pedobacter sp. UC225_65]|uniref:hypothetical protein n=1 Tax=Pedobacter sp. UC225_65 TaxID=3350173 RepID=UPI00366E8116